jgi:hypothetical protein
LKNIEYIYYKNLLDLNSIKVFNIHKQNNVKYLKIF